MRDSASSKSARRTGSRLRTFVSRCPMPPQQVGQRETCGAPLFVSGVSHVSANLQIIYKVSKRHGGQLLAASRCSPRQVRRTQIPSAFLLRQQGWDTSGTPETAAPLPVFAIATLHDKAIPP
jgi:hypothetical protein